MNITDLIVERLKQGKNVELPGIGMLNIELEEAHMNPTTGVFYPTRKTVNLTDKFEGDTSILAEICEKECVTENIAQMMWKNYLDALTDKLNRVGSHEFPNVGSLALKEGKFSFTPLDNINLCGDTEYTQPLQNVNIYQKDDSEDPFAVFERPIVETPAPVETPKEEPKPEPIVGVKEEVAPTSEEPKPIEEPVKEETPKTEEPKIEPVEVKENIEQEKTEEQPIVNDVVTETLKQLDKVETPEDNKGKKKKKGSKLWLLLLLLLLICGGLYYYFYIYQPNQKMNDKELSDDSIIEQEGEFSDFADLNVEEETEVVEDEDVVTEEEPMVEEEVETSEDEEEIAEATTESENAETEEATTEVNKTPKNENDFTNNTDLISYTQNDIFEIREQLCYQMSSYVEQYLANRGYQDAKQAMMDRVRRYADRRLEELLDNNTYSVRRFIPYDDYVYNYLYNDLKQRKGNRARIQVQVELMQNGEMKNILNTMIDELGLRKGGVAVAPKAPVEKKEVKPEPTAKIKETSQRGYDIVAGFYTNKSSAIKMTNALKQQGCDAYIIDKQGLYYVSMGSASTQTAAEAMLKHIKTWYDGDAAIRKL